MSDESTPVFETRSYVPSLPSIPLGSVSDTLSYVPSDPLLNIAPVPPAPDSRPPTRGD